ncbi:MAG: hypothetical protein NT170_00620 [Candidatus Moranbacteria bacterium]|nr:hypothetical protein [Candidatus Moranbacteria bacterium]
MEKGRGNFIEAMGEEGYISRDAGKKKPHARKRKSTDAKYREARESFEESAVEEAPPPARNLHVVARIPDKKAAYRVEPTREAAVRELLLPESGEEGLEGLEEKINSELTELEQGFAKSCIDEYPKELEKAISKIESKGSTVVEKQISAIRTSYISDAKRWGLGRQLAPEKAELIGKYLELKLPVGIPEEKLKETPKNTVETSGESLKDLNKKDKHMEIPVKEITNINIREQLKQDKEELGAAGMMSNSADPKNNVNISSGGKKVEETVSDQAVINQRKINRAREFAPKGMRNIAKVSTDGLAPEFSDVPLAPGEKANLERVEQAPVAPESKSDAEPKKGEKTLEELKADLDAKRAVYAKVDLDAFRKWSRLKNLLGASIKEVSDEDYSKAFHDYNGAWQDYLEAKRGDVLKKGNKEDAREFLREFEGAEEAAKFLNLKYDLKKEQSGYPAKILYGFEKMANGWKEMNWKKKIAISAAIFGVGALAGVTGGASFGLIGATAFTLRTVQRTLGAGAMYIGAKRFQDQRFLGKMNKELEHKLDTFLGSDEWLERIKNLESGFTMKSTENLFKSKERIEEMDSKHKRRALALAGLVGVGGTAFDMYRHGVFNGLGGAIKEKMVNSSILASSISAEGMGGGAAAMQAHEVLTAHTPEIKSGGSLLNWAESTNAAGADANVSDQFHKPSSLVATPLDQSMRPGVHPGASASDVHSGQPHPTEYPGKAPVNMNDQGGNFSEHVPADNASPRILGSHEVVRNGGIERSAQDIIKANPKAFGLDPENPRFHSQVGAKAHELAEDLRGRLGLKKGVFDNFASHRVQPGDHIKIFEDSSTGKPKLSYEGKAFGNRIPVGDLHHGSAAEDLATSHPAKVMGGHAGASQEIAPSKGGMPVEDVKPKMGVNPEDIKPRTGAVPENTLSKPHFTPENAVEPRAGAGEGAANAEKLANINHRVYLANRPLLGNIFHKFGISEYYNIYDQPMSKWDDLIGTGPNVAQDVSQADVVNVSNESWKKLNDLRSILKYYNTSGHENIGECLRRALADSRIAPIGHGESIGAKVQQAINEILNNKK